MTIAMSRGAPASVYAPTEELRRFFLCLHSAPTEHDHDEAGQAWRFSLCACRLSNVMPLSRERRQRSYRISPTDARRSSAAAACQPAVTLAQKSSSRMT